MYCSVTIRFCQEDIFLGYKERQRNRCRIEKAKTVWISLMVANPDSNLHFINKGENNFTLSFVKFAPP